MIGRDREVTELLSGLEEAAIGRGGVWLITGEAGIGKSRLTEEVAKLAEERGMPVHWGRCWEAGGAPAYWPWIQVLRSILASGDAVRLASDRTAAQLVQIMPEFADRVPQEGIAPQLEPEQALFALMDTVSGVLRESAVTSPMVVLLEDLHAADPASITLLDFVSRQLRTIPLLVIGNYREVEAQGEEAVEGLARVTRCARTLRLGRLGVDEVAECVREIAGRDPGPKVVAAIYEASEGNPLYVVEIAGLMQSRGDLDDVRDRIDIVIPDSVKTVIRERSAGLDATTHQQLDAAAVIGREFRSSDLAELLDADLEEVEGSLSEAETARILDRVGTDSFRFAHILIREVFLSNLTKQRRRKLHLRRADILADLETRGREVPWSELAHHLLEVGPEVDHRAVDACVRAAEQAMAQIAFDDAAELLARALTVVDRLPDADPHRRCSLLIERADALLRGGDVPGGHQVCREAAGVARQLGDAELLSRVALTYGSVFVYADVDPSLVDLLREALAMLGESDSTLRARLQARLAAAMQPADNPEEPMDLARGAIAMARRAGDRRTLLDTIRAGCSALMDLADPHERLALNREHVALADELGEPFEALRAHMRMVIDAVDLGDLETCDAAIEACSALASKTELPHHLWPVASFRAMRASMEGRFDDADRLTERARRQAERAQDPNAARTMAIQEFGFARAREEFDRMEALHARPTEEAVSGGFMDLFLRILHGSDLARMDRHDEALNGFVDRIVDHIVAFGDRSILCTAAEIAAGSSRSATAERIYERLVPFAEQQLSWGMIGLVCEGPISRTLALLASSLGRAEVAERHFKHALETAHKLGERPIAARIAYEYARHLARASGSSNHIEELLDRAWKTADELDLYGLEGLIDSFRGEKGEEEAVVDTAVHEIVPVVSAFSLERDGELWVCSCGDQRFNLKNTKGVRMLARLVAEPGREIHVLDLSGATPAERTVDLGDAGEVLDATAKAQYQRRIEELRSEIEEAEGFNDPGRAARAREELEVIAAELSKAFGLGGRKRRAGSAAERARVNVQRRLRDAVKRIAEQSPAAGKHLDWALRTGMYCVYDPS